MSARELLRWSWRQLTSMRTALVLLFLLALAAIPGSVIPQSDVDAFAVSRWQERHPELTPVYEKLQLFSVFDSAWFSAIYLLLAVSLVGCILPRTPGLLAWSAGPAAGRPAQPDPVAGPRDVHDEGAGRGRPRARRAGAGQAAVPGGRRRRDGQGSVSSERGYLREAGNLLFHISVLVVLAGLRDRVAVGLQGRRDRGGGQRLLQQPHAVRRLRAGQPDVGRGHGAVQLRRRLLRHRVADRAAPARAWRRSSSPT